MLDWVTAGVAATIATGLLGTDQPSLALIPGAIGALYIAGAISGNASVNACRQAREEFELVHHDVLPPADDDHPNLAPPGIAPSPPAPASVAQAATPPPQPAQPSSPQVAPPQRPAPQPPPQPQQPPDLTKQLTKQPAPEPNADEWPDFWREVSP